MSNNYVQVQPDSTGTKVETVTREANGNTVGRQVVTLGDGREELIAELLKAILEELRESRRVLCETTRQNYEILPKDDTL